MVKISSNSTVARNVISTLFHKSGHTNSEAGIIKCVKEIRNKPNPAIILITDDISTAFFKKGRLNW